MSGFAPSVGNGHSDEEPWYAGFDVVDMEATPVDELPEEDGFHLLCPVEGCEDEGEFHNLPAVADSDWTQVSQKDQILTNGTTLKEGYCPAHSLDAEDATVPLDSQESSSRKRDRDEYAMYDFLDWGESVALESFLLKCNHQSCHREKEFDALSDSKQDGWVSGEMVGPLTDGRVLYNGRCPEHHR
jgi:hypothetical protein